MPTTLLAIDDSVTMRKVLEMTFAGEDFRVVSAESADAGFAKLRSERPSIVLCDVTLDGPGGYAICAKIKSENPTVAVVLMASKQQPYDAHKGQSARADDFIEKPFDTQQLIDKVIALSKKQAGAPAPAPVAASPARAPTLSYGQNPVPGGIGTPPVPVPVPPAPLAASRQTAPGMLGAPAAAPSVSRAPTLLGAQLPPELTPKPVPAGSPAAQPVAAKPMAQNVA